MDIHISIKEDGTVDLLKEISTSKTRSEKGKSLLLFPETYIVIDIETTGLDTEFDEIIEISAVKYQNLIEIDQFNTLVKPTEEIDDFITNLTGITNDMLKNAPTIDDVILKFYNFIGSDLLVGYNVNFDINFLYDNLIEHSSNSLKNSFVDVMRLSKHLLPQLSNHKLETVSKHFGHSSIKHRAIDDCYVCNDCLISLKKLVLSNHNSLEEFYEELKLKKKSYVSASDITTTNTLFDETNPLFGKTVCFTGTLQKMTRHDAMQLVVDLGGICSNGLTNKTNFLVIGNNDRCTSIVDGKSNKQKKAESMILKGNDLEILSENTFYDMVMDH